MKDIELLRVVTQKQAKEIASKFGTPIYVYSMALLKKQAEKALEFPNAYGLTVRYAMKANSNAAILRFFDECGIHIDASSGYEAERAMRIGISPKKILLTSQQIPYNLKELVEKGVNYNACSLYQLEEYGKNFIGGGVSLRLNPGLGSGGTNRTNTGGPSSSFGIWYKDFDKLLEIAERYQLKIIRLHTHIGSGSDPKVWKKVALMSIIYAEKILEAGHDVRILNLGGGYKVGRMNYEKSTDLQECGEPIKQAFINFYKKTGLKLKLEIEPGTFLVANAGCLIAKVIDIKKTSWYNSIIINSGMTEVTRPALYGAQHPITIVPEHKTKNLETGNYIVYGHCCESGDILTPAPGNPEALQPRKLLKAEIGDLVVIGGTGAYCSSMCTKNYNSYPDAPEVLIDINNQFKLIKKAQTFKQMLENEL